MKSLSRSLATFVLVASAAAAPALAQQGLRQGAQVHPPYRGVVPAASDIVFSTRSKRPEAVQIARDFGATRIEWVYSTDKEFVASLKRSAPWFGGTINGIGPLQDEAGYARDFDGKILGAPWMAGWNGRWVTTTHPETQRFMSQQAARYLAAGADSIQFDDPLLQLYAAAFQAGDFNASTLDGFAAYLASHPDRAWLQSLGLADFKGSYKDYLKARHDVVDAKDYQRRFRTFPSTKLWLAYIQSTVEQHFEALRKQLNEGRSKPVPLSMNLSVLYEPVEANRFYFLARLADYSIAETHIREPAEMASQAATARALGIGFVASIRPQSLLENRTAIATLYALGAPALVPWDVWVGNDDAGQPKRFYGSVDEYGDLYRFVRRNADLFDGFETAALVGVVVRVDKTQPKPIKELVQTLVERQIPFAFVPVGGSTQPHRLDAQRLARFRLLVTPSGDAEFSGDELQVMQQSGVPRLAAGALKADRLGALQPFVAAPGGEMLRLYPRARPADPSLLVVHLVDPARAGSAAAEPGCRRRIGIHKFALDPASVSAAHWISGDQRTPLKVEPTDSATFLSLPGCPLWGIVALQLR